MRNISKYKSKVNNLFKHNVNLIKDNKKLIKVAATIMIIVVALIFFAEKEEKETIEVPKDTISESKENEKPKDKDVKDNEIIIDISGAIVTPGVYLIKEGARLYDVIVLAGGLTDNADIDAINQAELVSDGQKLYIPIIGEIPQNASCNNESSLSSSNGKVNINTASSEELQTISGIGPSTAQKIIEYRSVNGKFSSIEEIKNVSGIGDKTFERLKEHITVY